MNFLVILLQNSNASFKRQLLPKLKVLFEMAAFTRIEMWICWHNLELCFLVPYYLNLDMQLSFVLILVILLRTQNIAVGKSSIYYRKWPFLQKCDFCFNHDEIS